MPLTGAFQSSGGMGLAQSGSLSTSSAYTRGPSSAPRYNDGSLARGYRELSKNNTLAGRQAFRHFTREQQQPGPNRLHMVSRLRKKERFWLWRYLFVDFGRFFSSL